jgi:hypothetical protein
MVRGDRKEHARADDEDDSKQVIVVHR